MMKKILVPGVLILTLFACSHQGTVPAHGGATRLDSSQLKPMHPMKDWAFNPKVRILSDAMTARIRPVGQAVLTAEAEGEEPCREILTNSLAEDGARPGMQNEVSVAVSGDRIVVTYNDDNHRPDSVSGFTGSQDGGMTFTDGGGFIPAEGRFGGGDPLILADPNDPDRFVYIQLTYSGYSDSSILLHESLDGGKTFPPDQSRDILKGVKSPIKGKPMTSPAFFHDKEWAAWDGPSDTLALAWGLGTYTASYPVVITSNDGGRTWSDGVNLATENQMGGLTAVAAGTAGELYVAWIEYYSSTLRLSRSMDGGRTWEGPFLAADTFQAPFDDQATTSCGRTALNGEIRTATVPSLAVDPDTGALYLVYNYKQDKDSDDDSDIGFVRSTDRGETWSAPVRLNDDATLNDQFMPWVAAAGEGSLLAIFYDRRDDPKNEDMHVYAAQSLDGGETWLANRRLTCRSFPVAQDSCYMGDYNQVVTDGKFYYAAWGDNRDTVTVEGLDEPNPNVYLTRIGVRPRTRPVTPP